MAKDINKNEFTEETKLKLEIFQECFREWYPVFIHNRYITNVFIYDMFAGSGMDAIGNYGSPLIQKGVATKRATTEKISVVQRERTRQI